MKAKPTKPVKKKVCKKDIYEREILEVIIKNKLFTVVDIFAFYTGCSRGNFYLLNLDKLDSIKKALDDNKTKIKQSLKLKWYNSDNPTLQLALFKTICSDEERKALSMNYTELTGKDGKDLVINFIPCIKKNE